MIQIYCGDGKGKTTAAIGQAVRAAGRGKQVLIARFLKTDDSGEVTALQQIPSITVIPCQKTFGFTSSMSRETKQEAAAYYNDLLESVLEKASHEPWDMLVLDEIMAALEHDLVQEELLLQFLKNPPCSMEVVLTGRNPSAGLLELADYVSQIQAVHHPYQEKGVAAREGIEY
ncbi:MAG: cob(I)yrinic acid a,c-diamide adenosyltransferase [Lachnospiraceae bacterium]